MAIAASSLAALLSGPARRPAGLADGLRALVVDGRLAVRTRVPSERALAAELRISRGSVSRAYDRLREEATSPAGVGRGAG
jgi:DNA-binding transcriptional MocR family regulator